jgi:hypothetical protein
MLPQRGCRGGTPEVLSDADRAAVEAQIPRLADSTYRVTSPKDRRYNCFAWAGGDSRRFWSPTMIGSGVYWPPGIPALPSMSGVIGVRLPWSEGVQGFSELEAGL